MRIYAFALIAAALALPVVASAQISPEDSGAGVKRGMAEQNNSGQPGTVTLFKRGKNTLVVIELAGAAGRTEPAHVHRGHECDAIDPKPAIALAPVVNGISRTLVKASEARLLSGNYVVNVHSSPQNMTRYVSCGELYQ